MDSSADRGEDLIIPAEKQREELAQGPHQGQSGFRSVAVACAFGETGGVEKFECLVSAESGEQ